MVSLLTLTDSVTNNLTICYSASYSSVSLQEGGYREDSFFFMQLVVVVVVIVVAATNVIDKAPLIDLFRWPFFLGGSYMPLYAPTQLNFSLRQLKLLP
jgi:hypothetical protein